MSDNRREYLRFKWEVFNEAVSEASKTTAASFTGLIVVLCVFALVTYGNFVTDEIPVPFLQLKLNRWHAAALGPPLVSFAAFNFACSRALLQMRIKVLTPHLRVFLDDLAQNTEKVPVEEFVGAVLYPSFHVVLDYLYIRNWRGFRFVMGLMMFLWILMPIAITHMTYTVLLKYQWNPILVVVYFLALTVSVYSAISLLKAQEADFYFDFSD
jgi:hypothetical protein